jgi:hypothetical protein
MKDGINLRSQGRSMEAILAVPKEFRHLRRENGNEMNDSEKCRYISLLHPGALDSDQEIRSVIQMALSIHHLEQRNIALRELARQLLERSLWNICAEIIDLFEVPSERITVTIEMANKLLEIGDRDDESSVWLDLNLWKSYYGAGYERGDPELFIRSAEWLEQHLPGSEIYYGHDVNDQNISRFDSAARNALLENYRQRSAG